MEKFLVAIPYHVYDYEVSDEELMCSTGIFIQSKDDSKAIEWAEKIAEKLFLFENPQETRAWRNYEYKCWIEDDMFNSGWSHCLNFFQTVSYGDYPDIENMGTNAYRKWTKNNGINYESTVENKNGRGLWSIIKSILK